MNVIARLDRAIQYPEAGGYWIARSSRAMTAQGAVRRLRPSNNAALNPIDITFREKLHA
jgi:hypothetical protein